MTYKVSDENGTRNATADEAAILDVHAAAYEAHAAAADAKAAAITSARNKLTALGLTADEITALLGV
jgi:hypothetical protein